MNGRLVTELRRRVLAIGLSTLTLIFFMRFVHQSSFRAEVNWGRYFLVEWLVIATCVIGNAEPWWNPIASLANQFSEAFPGSDRRKRQLLPIVDEAYYAERRLLRPLLREKFLFSVLVFAVLGNFYSVWLLIVATGGITGSPFTQYLFTMVVMGQVMAERPRTALILVGVGGIAFGSLVVGQLQGFAHITKIRTPVRTLQFQFLAVTLVNLVVSALVNYIARGEKQDSEEGTVSTGESE